MNAKRIGYLIHELIELLTERNDTSHPDYVANGCSEVVPKETIYETVEQIKIRKNDTTTIIWDAVMIQQMEKDLEDLKKRSGLIPSRLKEPPFNIKDIPIAVAFPEPIQIKQTDFSVLYLPIFPQNGVNSALIWTGPGWYVVDVVEPDLWFALIAGPFDSYERVAQELRHANTED